ncbi:transposase family protein [Hymenobacter sp. NST-14]|uniref:transposase family protein n=1 Tax=Hymenobacter piscis TaxID=2839984 RepID=UPI001C02D691|nr:transposase family protein [Hymenobacter piscis]MBT9395231.1 transposase family protein [Hymenobacter piscis]
MLISDQHRWIGYVSPCYEGRTHDFTLLKTVLPPQQNWFKPFTVRLDLGFLGFANTYAARRVRLPHRKPCGAELTAKQCQQNRRQAQKRVRIEHSIGGLKRYRILSDRLRLHDFQRYDDLLEVCAGLWNFHLTP